MVSGDGARAREQGVMRKPPTHNAPRMSPEEEERLVKRAVDALKIGVSAANLRGRFSRKVIARAQKEAGPVNVRENRGFAVGDDV